VFQRVLRVGMRSAERVIVSALYGAPDGHLRGHRAVHDAEPGQAPQRFQSRPPDPVLEGGLGHDRHPGPQQQLHQTE